MASYQGVFKRYEKKYLVSSAQYGLLLRAFGGRLQPDQYGESTVCNLYFDTPDARLIRASLEKPVYKEKLRLRSYGIPDAGGTVFIELKKKYKGVVYKRRIDMTLEAATEYLVQSRAPENMGQIAREVDWFLALYPRIRPAMYISYQRTAFAGTDEPGLRVTFDREILWREEELRLDAGAWGTPLLAEDQRLMEIKIPGAMPLWLARLLDTLRVYPVSFSKYGRAYQESRLPSERKERVTCA